MKQLLWPLANFRVPQGKSPIYVIQQSLPSILAEMVKFKFSVVVFFLELSSVFSFPDLKCDSFLA